MTPGEEVTVSDGQGMDYFCRIAELTKEEVRLDIVDSWHSFVELPAKIYLFQGLPKADKMELIIQKAVELGVYEIVPVATKRAVVKLDPKKEEKKRLRWQSIAESAAKQAGRALIPQIATCITFEKALRMCNGLDAALIPYEKAEGMQHARDQVRALHGKHSIGILSLIHIYGYLWRHYQKIYIRRFSCLSSIRGQTGFFGGRNRCQQLDFVGFSSINKNL